MMGLALFDAAGRGDAAQRSAHVASARAWLASDDPSWGFSFVNVCSMLDLDPAADARR
jgi:hypothetical protein